MAKKILYKVTAYHCPRCGAACEPTKKYCDYCSRDLRLRQEVHNQNKMRLLIDCNNFIFFDEISKIEFQKKISTLDATVLEDTYKRIVCAPPTYDFEITVPFTERGLELLKHDYTGKHKIRFEHLGLDQGYESEAYIANSTVASTSFCETPMHTITFISIGNPIIGKAIPKEVLDEMRCPNCGAPINSRYGACPYCSGWSEIEW